MTVAITQFPAANKTASALTTMPACVKGSGCRPIAGASSRTGAGVRKPPGKEPARDGAPEGDRALWGFEERAGCSERLLAAAREPSRPVARAPEPDELTIWLPGGVRGAGSGAHRSGLRASAIVAGVGPAIVTIDRAGLGVD